MEFAPVQVIYTKIMAISKTLHQHSQSKIIFLIWTEMSIYLSVVDCQIFDYFVGMVVYLILDGLD